MVKIENVSVKYNTFTGLQPTSLNFNRSDFTVLIGKSGAGKSTLMRCLNYLIKPSTGYVITKNFGRLDTAIKIRQHRRLTGMIFQQHQLIERQTVLQNVLVGRVGYYSSIRSIFPLPKKDKILALQSLERVQLLDKATVRVDQLSGGEQQRVGIARALVQTPQLILADEPVASLDPSTAKNIMKILYTICKSDNIPVILSLHHLDYAMEFADRIIALKKGRVVFDASPEKLKNTEIYSIYEDTDIFTNNKNKDINENKPDFVSM